jgi:hypothetical protein
MIARIENTFLCRLVLLLSIPVLILGMAVYGFFCGAITSGREIGVRFSNVWQGRKPRNFSGRWVPA